MDFNLLKPKLDWEKTEDGWRYFLNVKDNIDESFVLRISRRGDVYSLSISKFKEIFVLGSHNLPGDILLFLAEKIIYDFFNDRYQEAVNVCDQMCSDFYAIKSEFSKE